MMLALTQAQGIILVLGGGISTAWDMVSTPLRHGLDASIALRRGEDTEAAALRGTTMAMR